MVAERQTREALALLEAVREPLSREIGNLSRQNSDHDRWMQGAEEAGRALSLRLSALRERYPWWEPFNRYLLATMSERELRAEQPEEQLLSTLDELAAR